MFMSSWYSFFADQSIQMLFQGRGRGLQITTDYQELVKYPGHIQLFSFLKVSWWQVGSQAAIPRLQLKSLLQPTVFLLRVRDDGKHSATIITLPPLTSCCRRQEGSWGPKVLCVPADTPFYLLENSQLYCHHPRDRASRGIPLVPLILSTTLPIRNSAIPTPSTQHPLI